MIILDSEWDEVRKAFDEGEKIILRSHVRGHTICPRGLVMDENSTNETVVKLVALVQKLRGK